MIAQVSRPLVFVQPYRRLCLCSPIADWVSWAILVITQVSRPAVNVQLYRRLGLLDYLGERSRRRVFCATSLQIGPLGLTWWGLAQAI